MWVTPRGRQAINTKINVVQLPPTEHNAYVGDVAFMLANVAPGELERARRQLRRPLDQVRRSVLHRALCFCTATLRRCGRRYAERGFAIGVPGLQASMLDREYISVIVEKNGLFRDYDGPVGAARVHVLSGGERV